MTSSFYFHRLRVYDGLPAAPCRVDLLHLALDSIFAGMNPKIDRHVVAIPRLQLRDPARLAL
ncbi:MAG TPA: hypothetical protein VGY58_20450 [Gemmataceae bacterium]|nr:hypothetical protein [Gemmataceae bacterium]